LNDKRLDNQTAPLKFVDIPSSLRDHPCDQLAFRHIYAKKYHSDVLGRHKRD
jgi:hypothetical protein